MKTIKTCLVTITTLLLLVFLARIMGTIGNMRAERRMWDEEIHNGNLSSAQTAHILLLQENEEKWSHVRARARTARQVRAAEAGMATAVKAIDAAYVAAQASDETLKAYWNAYDAGHPASKETTAEVDQVMRDIREKVRLEALTK